MLSPSVQGGIHSESLFCRPRTRRSGCMRLVAEFQGLAGKQKPRQTAGGSRIDGGLLVEHLHGIDQAAPHAVERLRQ